MSYRILCLAAALLTGVSAGAQAAPVATISGAVGLDERAHMIESYGDYNLHCVFAQTDGAFVADIELSIRDARDGTLVWRGVSEGPLFFARVPDGQYQVNARYDGRTLTKRIGVGREPGPMHYFHWKIAP